MPKISGSLDPLLAPTEAREPEAADCNLRNSVICVTFGLILAVARLIRPGTVLGLATQDLVDMCPHALASLPKNLGLLAPILGPPEAQEQDAVCGQE
jgi:hypothetical protein